MKEKIKNALVKCKVVFAVFDILLSPFTLLATVWVKLTRKMLNIFGQGGMPATEKIFMGVGVLPIFDHYYEPMINPGKYLKDSLKKNRKLPGISFDTDQEQLLLLSAFKYNSELIAIANDPAADFKYNYSNVNYGPGDAEYLYSIVRHYKPRKIVEIGSGNSTLMARNAVVYNQKEDAGYQCKHVCIEPYEMQWLEKLGIDIVRMKVEDVDLSVFADLGENDILFIDSSHMIRPQGDVLFEYLQLLPMLKPGVIIHIHDIFTPNEYPDEWLKKHFLWNEQYLLEAFLCYNERFKIIGATNYLFHKYNKEFLDKFPVLAKGTYEEPSSFWMVKK